MVYNGNSFMPFKSHFVTNTNSEYREYIWNEEKSWNLFPEQIRGGCFRRGVLFLVLPRRGQPITEWVCEADQYSC